MTESIISKFSSLKYKSEIFLKEVFDEVCGRYYIVGGSDLESVPFEANEYNDADNLYNQYRRYIL